MPAHIDATEDYFNYTSGRWLWKEAQQLKQRYKWFDVNELKRVAVQSVNAQACLSMKKVAEGGSNKIFRLVMDNERVVMARIPNPNAGPPFYTTASEVATMDFVKSILGIPVPTVLSWSADPKNSVQSEYILMEEAPGVGLEKVWDGMELSDKLKIVDEIVAIEKKLISTSFSQYGSLYFKENSFSGCVDAILSGNMPRKDETQGRFVIGPVVHQDFWDGERAQMDISRGPWPTPQEYLNAIAVREMEWIKKYAKPRDLQAFLTVSEQQSDPEAHLELYKKFLKIIPYLLPREQGLIKSILWHWDIHAPNIFVDGATLTRIIDWQESWCGPACLQARQPRLFDYNGKILLELPETYHHMDDPEEKRRIRTQVELSTILWSYEEKTRQENPDLHRIYQMHQGRTVRDLVEFAKGTWEGDLITFRECLIRVARNWTDFHTDVPCPISFTEEELKKHIEDGESWNEQADFWDSLRDLVHRDGWTTNENYEQALEIFSQLRESGLNNLSGEERAAFEEQTRWATKDIHDA